MIYVLSSARHFAKLVLGERRGGGGSGTEVGPELRRAHHQPRDPAQPPHHHAAARGHGAQRATSHTPGLPGPRGGASGMAITCYNVMKQSYVFKNIFRLLVNPYQNYKYNTTVCTKSESSSRRTFHHWPTFHQSQHSPSCPGCGSSPSRHRSESPGRGTRSLPCPGRGRRSPQPASGFRRRHSSFCSAALSKFSVSEGKASTCCWMAAVMADTKLMGFRSTSSGVNMFSFLFYKIVSRSF